MSDQSFTRAVRDRVAKLFGFRRAPEMDRRFSDETRFHRHNGEAD